jgi:mannose-6-phosphate isomerase-like protein (cupin superfamily)
MAETTATTTNSAGEIFATAVPQGKYLVDPYQNWAEAEGIPIVTGAAIDLATVHVQPWARFGVKAAFCHLDGRDDFTTVVVTELLPSSRSSMQRHLYEEICYVISGNGATEIELPDGGTRTVEWGPKSLFTTPMNARYRHHNTSREPARFAAVSDMRYLMSLYRNDSLIFDTDMSFPERDSGALSENLATLALDKTDEVHVAGRNLVLAQGSLATDVRELAPGSYAKASRQLQGSHIFGVDGEGYTLVWKEGAETFTRMAWRHGVVCAAGGMLFHQHFNAGAAPARFLDVQLGSARFPMFRARRASYGDASVYAAGSATIPYAQQDPRIHAQWLETIKTKGVTSQMRG